METGPRWSTNTLQRLWTSLRQINSQANDEAITRVKWLITETQINGRSFTKTLMIGHTRSFPHYTVYHHLQNDTISCNQQALILLLGVIRPLDLAGQATGEERKNGIHIHLLGCRSLLGDNLGEHTTSGIFLFNDCIKTC